MSTETAKHARDPLVSGARKGAIYGIIISFSGAALVGIIALLGGDFGETQGKILLTTVLFGAFSITALCHLAIADRAMRIVGVSGLLASGVALVTGLVLVWRDWDAQDGGLDWLKIFAAAGILAVSFAHANLLLLLAGRRRAAIRWGLAATLVAIAVVAVMLILPILTDGEFPGEDAADLYWRVFGVIAILDVLGTVVVPVLALFLRDGAGPSTPSAAEPQGAAGAHQAAATLRLEVPADLAEAVRSRAAQQGSDPDAVALDALRRGLESVDS
ncbi:hypothetical protein [Microcella pacifica]|uniref:Uncharacterized protein n=1 Tax=Microcella pacifica TaxID=2591847 RepID=A0A9E5JPH8_9MICO|nr:hypothetical protein [Microcella pacifica]NHF63414.1 hypothetical protein [Microcella pacifica]